MLNDMENILPRFSSSSTFSVYAFADPTKSLRRSYASQLRDGDALRAVVTTQVNGTR